MIDSVLIPSDRTAVRPASPHVASLESDLARVAASAIFFGHQSVGANLLDGLRELASPFPHIPLKIVESTVSLRPHTFGHAFLGENGRPESKLAAFACVIDAGVGGAADVAFLKLCYTDVHRGSDPARLFAAYEAMLTELSGRHPRVVFAHLTVPLTGASRESGPASIAKRLIGRPADAIADNAARERFNDLLRATYPRSAVFDLAKIESTGPAGDRSVRRHRGRDVPMLHASYTDDGGHLNAPARVRVARQLVAFVSGIARPA